MHSLFIASISIMLLFLLLRPYSLFRFMIVMSLILWVLIGYAIWGLFL